ncbi:MAG: hypothetical protein BWK73_37170 [Thiothrix lacustris]|uniref:DUF4402 domain-containing protein n=1 Tax=Thiothrix lacustris TaxID=525917 RepID=A0A1Y1QF51_9GAMM|nr:MAG: hypothetical protein BWK73_37170 [Thiothrix lacustris]
MRQPHLMLGLLTTIASAPLLADHTQAVKITIPKVAIVDIQPKTSLTFAEGGNGTVSGSHLVSITSNDPQTKLQITPTGISLTVTSSSLDCPHDSSTSTITCTVGVNITKDSTLAFNATRTTDAPPNIAYTLTQ